LNYLNGKYTDTPFSEGELYGTGVFETILVTNGKPLYTLEHYTRLSNGCQILDINMDSLSYENFQSILNEYIKNIGLEHFGLRFSLLKRGATHDIMINNRDITYKKEHYERGFSIKTSTLRKNPTSPMTYIKSICYTDNLISLKNIRHLGFDEALHLNFKEEICEGAISNIFFIKNGLIKTPAVECGLLPGIMRGKIIEKLNINGIKYEEGYYSLEEILEADEVFITNSLINIMWVSRINNKFYSQRKNTNKISELFSK
jgi:branched-subunit amino acid aminotransferase/4-amino-4-deoxychorismate lyase